MKKLLILAAIVFAAEACSPSRSVGDTPASEKAKRDAANRVGSQFNGVR